MPWLERSAVLHRMIALSYRRDGSMAVIDQLYERLSERFGRQNVFRVSYSTLDSGYVREHSSAAMDQAEILIALIDPAWLGEDGASRGIEDPADPIRLDVSSALWRGIRVIPVLVDGGEMPKPEQLPADIRELALCSALSLDSGRDFLADSERLIAALGATRSLASQTGAWRRLTKILAIVLVALSCFYWIAVQLKRRSHAPITPPAISIARVADNGLVRSTTLSEVTPILANLVRTEASAAPAISEPSPARPEVKFVPPTDIDGAAVALSDFVGTWSSVTGNPMAGGGAITVHDQLDVEVDSLTETISTEWMSQNTRVFRMVMRVRFSDAKVSGNRLSARSVKADVIEVSDPKGLGKMSNIAQRAKAAAEAGLNLNYDWTLNGTELRRADTVWQKQK